ncbi:MAG: dockerin type I domain-containing protein [Planctomycetia bacterium]|jgi:hypothetical protein
MRKKLVNLLMWTCCVMMLIVPAGDVLGVALDRARVVLPQSIAAAGSGTVGAFTYDQANNIFYTTIFGSDSGLRTIANQSGQWIGGWSTSEDAYSSDMLRFMRSTDVPGGVVDFTVATSGGCAPSGVLLNPVPLTIDMVLADANGDPVDDGSGGYVITPVTYGVGELAYIMDIATEVKIGGVKQYEYTKKMYRWDLRAIGSSTSVQPDFANGQSGQPGVSGPAWGDLNQADWNDVLSVVFTEQDLRDEVTAQGGSPGSDNFGRQFAWSTDGLAIYAVESSRYQGGIYKIDPTDGAIEWIYRETGSSISDTLGSETAVLATTVHDYTGGSLAGDQIFFDGSVVNGNEGGISYVVHDGTNTSAAQVLLDGSAFKTWVENDGIDVNSITTDAAGNVYFYAYGTDSVGGQKTGGLFVRDTQGRLACLLSRAMMYEVNETEDGTRKDSGGMLRLQTYADSGGVHVLYRGDNKYVGEVDVPVLGDLTDDGLVDAADRTFMIDQYKKSCYDAVPMIVGDGEQNYIDYLTADMNGSADGEEESTGALENVAVTFTDVETLAQFVDGGLLTGDLDWDGVAGTLVDWAIFSAGLGNSPESGVWSWFDGDLDLDGDVDEADLAIMNPAPGDANCDGMVDASDATILAGNWQQASGASWTTGDFNGDGAVDASDATILAGNWQYAASPAPSTVPEPSSVVMLMAVLGAVALLRRRK